MIQFQPAQDVKDALKGKTETSSTQPPIPAPEAQQKPPLAMSLDQNSKIAGIFKSSYPGSSDPATTESPVAQPAPPLSETPASPTETPEVPATTAPDPATPTQEVTASPTGEPSPMMHDATDPHGVHDTAHPDEPPAFGQTVATMDSVPVPTTPTPVPTPPAPENNPEPPTPTSPAVTAPDVTPTPAEPVPATAAVPVSDFQQRLEAKITEKQTEIATKKQKIDALLSETAAEQKALKASEAELKQLTALRDLPQETLSSVLSVAQPSQEK